MTLLSSSKIENLFSNFCNKFKLMSQRTNYVVVPIEDWNVENHVVSHLILGQIPDQFRSVPIMYQDKPFFLKIPNLYCRYGSRTILHNKNRKSRYLVC